MGNISGRYRGNQRSLKRDMAVTKIKPIKSTLKKALLFLRCHLIRKESIVGHQKGQGFHPAPVNIMFNLQNS